MSQQYFKQAELALATYASLNAGTPDRAALEFAGLSESQAIIFANAYHVVTQHTDNTGLSVTVFKNTDAQNPQTILAIRGTKLTDFGDIFADLSTETIGTRFARQ